MSSAGDSLAAAIRPTSAQSNPGEKPHPYPALLRYPPSSGPVK